MTESQIEKSQVVASIRMKDITQYKPIGGRTEDDGWAAPHMAHLVDRGQFSYVQVCKTTLVLNTKHHPHAARTFTRSKYGIDYLLPWIIFILK